MLPIMFALAMEYLSRLLNGVADDPRFRFHPRCKKLRITHLLFGEGLLLFRYVD